MDFKNFTFGLGDLLIGYQIVESNLASIFGKKETLADFEADVSVIDGVGGDEAFSYLARNESYFAKEIALTFIDIDNFEESMEFEKASDALLKARKYLYEINAKIASFAAKTAQKAN